MISVVARAHTRVAKFSTDYSRFDAIVGESTGGAPLN
jgi:hypothetical protein